MKNKQRKTKKKKPNTQILVAVFGRVFLNASEFQGLYNLTFKIPNFLPSVKIKGQQNFNINISY
jgi:hypothetical protein